MNIVKESNLGSIKSVFNDDASNSHYYKIIHKTINGQIVNLEFAKPIIQVNQGSISWQSKFDGPYLNYTSLNIESKKYVDAIIQDSLNSMASLLKGNNDPDFMDNIIEIPNEESIFYTKNSNNTINVILTEWGYTNDEHQRKEGVLKKIFTSAMKSSLIVKFKSVKDEKLEGVKTFITAEGLNFSGVSDNEGAIKLNNLEKGNTILISSPDNIFDEVNLKIGSIEEHTILVERKFTLSFQVLTSKSRPVANTDFFFRSELFQNLILQTDKNGICLVKHTERDGDFELFSNAGDQLLQEILPSEDQTYTVIYDPLVEDDAIDPIAPLITNNIELEFLNWRKKPITNQQVEIYGQNGKTNYITDKNGIVEIDHLSKDIEYGFFMNFKGTNWKTEFTHTDKSKYSFVVKRRRVLWWWLPFVFFFLLLLLIPSEISHEYTVLDKSTKQPIDATDISSSQASIYQVQKHNDKTDSIGELSIAYGKYPLYKQIFGSPDTDVFAKKHGYESLQATVPLGYFDTRQSIIYLNKLQPSAPVNTEPVLPCGGGENYNGSGSQIKRFDLGNSDRNFLFEYYNDTQLDIINVYCDDGSLLFKVDTTTDTSDFQDSKTIYAPCRYISVEVLGETNWGIRVNCPE